MKAKITAGNASTMKSVRHPCKPKNVVSSNTPANGPPMILENNKDVSIKEIAFARSFGKNQLGINKEYTTGYNDASHKPNRNRYK